MYACDLSAAVLTTVMMGCDARVHPLPLAGSWCNSMPCLCRACMRDDLAPLVLAPFLPSPNGIALDAGMKSGGLWA